MLESRRRDEIFIELPIKNNLASSVDGRSGILVSFDSFNRSNIPLLWSLVSGRDYRVYKHFVPTELIVLLLAIVLSLHQLRPALRGVRLLSSDHNPIRALPGRVLQKRARQ